MPLQCRCLPIPKSRVGMCACNGVARPFQRRSPAIMLFIYLRPNGPQFKPRVCFMVLTRPPPRAFLHCKTYCAGGLIPEISPRGGSRCAEGVGRISKNIMFPVFRQHPAKMANSPLREFNVLYNAAMWLPVGGYFGRWARYTTPPACPGTFSRRRWLFLAFGTSMRPPLSLASYALFEMRKAA